MTRRLLITALITAAAATAQAQQSKVLVLVGEVVDNQFIFGRNADDPPLLSQRVLQRNHGLHGISSEDTIIKPDASLTVALMTGNPSLTFSASNSTISRPIGSGSWVSDGFVVGQFIVVAGANNGVNNLQYRRIMGVTSNVLTVDAPLVNEGPISGLSVRANDAFVTTAGYPNSGDAGPVERICLDGGYTDNVSDTSNPDVAHAILVAAHRPAVRFCRITGWRGIGIQTRFDPTLEATATHQITGNTIHSCHTGIRTGSGDQKIIDNTILGCRDYGLYIAAGNTHNVSAHNHYYAMTNSDHDGTAVYNNGDFFRSIGDTFADSHYGYIGPADTDWCVFYGIYCQRNNRRAMLIEGTENTIIGSTFNLPYATSLAPWNDVRGVEITGARNLITDSMFWLSNFKHPATPGDGNGPATAIKVSGDNNRVVNTRLLDFEHPVGQARGIHLVGVVDGFQADASIWGFEDTGDVVLKIDSNQISGVNVTIRGNSVEDDNFPDEPDATDAQHYVDIPSNWDGDTNSIAIIDEATGNSFELVGGTAY